MNRRFHINPFVNEPENPGPTLDNGPDDSPRSTPSPKKSKRSVQKKVVSVRIGDVDGSRSKGEGYPPSDSWAWRKYGQKPIKGSPYPRGYYRCSSSKGCPARKQVERSRVDPTTLVITYSCEHNHPFPTTKHNPTPAAAAAATIASVGGGDGGATTISAFPPEDFAVFANQRDLEPDDKFAELGDDSLLTPDEFWFSDVASASPTVLESPIFVGNGSADDDLAMMFMMGEEDESLFADLGELPECSVVFRRSVLEQDEHRRRCSVDAPWCGSTG